MKLWIPTFLLSLIIVLPLGADDALPAADDWYLHSYAPLWKEKAWENVEEIAEHFERTVSGRQSMTKSLRDNMQEWRSTGWLGSEVAGHQFEQINLSTAVFKTKWRDSYADGSEDFECSWYLVDSENDTWAINYDVVIDCDEHGL